MNSLNYSKLDFSSIAFKTMDGERCFIGKLCEVTILDGVTFDIWVDSPSREPVGTRKLNNLEKAFSHQKCWEQARYVRLIGEPYLETTDRSFVWQIAQLCRVKRKSRVSGSTRERLYKRLGQINTKMLVSV